jgi:hypothetical protein
MKFIFIAMAVLLSGCATSHTTRSFDQPAGCSASDAVAQWKARMPQYSKKRILSEALMGNPNARIMATGGIERIVEQWDKDNKQIKVLVNEAGNIIRATDSKTGCDITPTEYYRRVIK